MMKTSNDSFGGTTTLKVGDMVFWSEIGRKHTGIISSMYEYEVGGRSVMYARVFCFEKEQNCEILSLTLKLLSKKDSITEEN